MGAVIGAFGMSSVHWYGIDPVWREAVERDARRMNGRRLVVDERQGVLTYLHEGMHVPARAVRVPVRVEFHQAPAYDTFGLEPRDYPRVFADPGAESKHRMPLDDALCLYDVSDPVRRRWTSEKGLQALFDMVADHLFYEDIWRDTGTWPVPDAPHGFQR